MQRLLNILYIGILDYLDLQFSVAVVVKILKRPVHFNTRTSELQKLQRLLNILYNGILAYLDLEFSVAVAVKNFKRPVRTTAVPQRYKEA